MENKKYRMPDLTIIEYLEPYKPYEIKKGL